MTKTADIARWGGRRGTVSPSLRANTVVVPILAFVMSQSAWQVTANSPISSYSLHPVLRWVCSLRDNAFKSLDIGEEYFSIDARSDMGQNVDFCYNFRGGERAGSNVTDGSESSGSTILVEKIDEPGDYRYTKSPYAFSLYQTDDGSRDDPDGIPARYMKMQGGRRENAKKALDLTLEWRKEHDIDTILARPHDKFDICKRVFPHYFCGRDDTDHVILLQRPGLIDLDLAHVNGLSGDDLLYHYIYEMEYLWQVLEPSPNGTMTSIIDLTGLNLSVLRKRELLSFVQKFCSTMDAHFPTRSHKTLLINSPKWFGAIYKLISPLLRESTKKKISILSKGKTQDEELKQLLSECPVDDDEKSDNVPPAQMENDLRDFVLARLQEAGVDMRPVIS